MPVAARWCMLAALLNAVVWSVVTPPFHAPDETTHLAYVQYLAETGEVPDNPQAKAYSPEEATLLDALRFDAVRSRARERAVTTDVLDAEVDRAANADASRQGGGGISQSSSQPPLYYAAQAVVYHASPWKDLLARLWVMRLFSCLLATATVLFTFLFLREVLPRDRWTWTVGALAVAFQPVFGHISSSLSPDSLLFAASAALLFGLARAFRRGLTVRLGLGIGVALAVGTLGKLNFVALLPGALLGLALLVARAPSGLRRGALSGAAAATGVLGAAILGYVALNTLVWDRAALGGVVSASATVAAGEQAVPTSRLASQLSYTWQLYLPRLPFMEAQFDYFPPWETWFQGFVGVFGWLDTPFPDWAYQVGLAFAAPLLALLALAAIRARSALRGRAAELVCYAALIVALLVSIGPPGLRYFEDTGFRFEQVRYLLPLLPLYAAGVALAVRAAGTRLSRPLAATVIVVLISHGLFAQLLVISRFYG